MKWNMTKIRKEVIAMADYNTIQEAKKNALIAINDWCQDLMKDRTEVIRCGYILKHCHRSFKVDVSRYGISICGDGKFSSTMQVRPSGLQDNLVYQSVGAELVYQWPDIKKRILSEYKELQRREEMLLNFEV